ncbi:MAG TPA: hypothetical protein VH573_14550 [Mycobacteriales bacterium]|jgi:hypothetical protein
MPSLPDRAERLIALGAHELAGVPAAELRAAAAAGRDEPAAVLVLGRQPAHLAGLRVRRGAGGGQLIRPRL